MIPVEYDFLSSVTADHSQRHESYAKGNEYYPRSLLTEKYNVTNRGQFHQEIYLPRGIPPLEYAVHERRQ